MLHHQLTNCWHHNDVIMGAIASQITSLTIVYSTFYSGADQRKHQSSASLSFVWGNSPETGEFPAQMATNTEYISTWWRHHGGYLQGEFCSLMFNLLLQRGGGSGVGVVGDGDGHLDMSIACYPFTRIWIPTMKVLATVLGTISMAWHFPCAVNWLLPMSEVWQFNPHIGNDYSRLVASLYAYSCACEQLNGGVYASLSLRVQFSINHCTVFFYFIPWLTFFGLEGALHRKVWSDQIGGK